MSTGEAASSPTARRMVLGGQLRRLREAAEVTREEAGNAIRGSESKISRLELGRVGFKERDVADLLALYGVYDAAEREAFLELVRESNQPGWWHRYNDLVPRWFQDYVGLEESAARIHTYEVLFVPGLLQTERYARAVVAQGRPEIGEDEAARRVALRMRRQKVLAHPAAPRLWAVMDEAVLHRPLGGKDVHDEQLEYLLEATTRPNVTVQIVPLQRGRCAAEGSFTLLRFAEPSLPDVVYLEHLCGAIYLDKPEEVELYAKIANRLAVEAETPDETRKIISKIVRGSRRI